MPAVFSPLPRARVPETLGLVYWAALRRGHYASHLARAAGLHPTSLARLVESHRWRADQVQAVNATLAALPLIG